MTEQSPRRLLRVDDDPASRFIYEANRIRREGWELEQVASVLEAAQRLRDQRFDAMLLDQMIDGSDVDSDLMIWSGCRLLWWLRGSSWKPVAGEKAATWSQLAPIVPMEENRAIPVAILSAFHTPVVQERTRNASPQDNELRFMSKPVDLQVLLGFLKLDPKRQEPVDGR